MLQGRPGNKARVLQYFNTVLLILVGIKFQKFLLNFKSLIFVFFSVPKVPYYLLVEAVSAVGYVESESAIAFTQQGSELYLCRLFFGIHKIQIDFSAFIKYLVNSIMLLTLISIIIFF